VWEKFCVFLHDRHSLIRAFAVDNNYLKITIGLRSKIRKETSYVFFFIEGRDDNTEVRIYLSHRLVLDICFGYLVVRLPSSCSSYCTMSKMITREDVLYQLATVIDPELHIDIVALGLIYEVVVKRDSVRVVMTLTTPGCPLAPIIDSMIKEALSPLGDIEVVVELVWDPPWTKEMMAEEARLKLEMM